MNVAARIQIRLRWLEDVTQLRTDMVGPSLKGPSIEAPQPHGVLSEHEPSLAWLDPGRTERGSQVAECSRTRRPGTFVMRVVDPDLDLVDADEMT